MVSGSYNLSHGGSSSEEGTKMPDLPHRDSQRQTIPIEEEDLPPAYEEPHHRNAQSSAANHDTTRPTPDAYRPNPAAVASFSRLNTDPDGYLKTDPMHWDLKEENGDWSKHDQESGCLCSDTGGVLCSARGGVICSDREGFVCSDRQGMYCSDRGGFWCSDLGGSICSSGGGEAERKRKEAENKRKQASCGGA